MTILFDLIDREFGLEGKEGGRWWRSHEHSSLVYDAERDIFFFNAEGISGDLFIWLTRVKGYDYETAKDFIKQSDKNGSYSFIHTIKDQKEQVLYPKLIDIFYEEGINAPRDYWESRGINNTTISRFKLGYHNGWYTIPIFQDNVFRNFQLRREEPTKQIRSYYKEQGRFLYNSDILRITDTVYICEGPTDALRLIQEGLPAISHNAGSEGWDDSWFKYFIGQKNIYINYDNDKAGITGAKKVAKNLGEFRCKLFNFYGYDDKYDVIDFFRNGGTIEQYKNLIEMESKYSFEV